jgi:uncharacterized protein YqeY
MVMVHNPIERGLPVSLQEKLTADMKEAMKAREADRLSVIRMLLADIKKLAIDTQKQPTEEEEISFLSTQAKRRRDSIEAFTAGAREDLAATERAELAVIETYLPAQVSAEEVMAMAKEVIAEVGATTAKDVGKVMGKLSPKLKGRFPGKDIKPIVESLLQG